MITMKGHRILVDPDPVEEVSEGGIIIASDKKLERTGIQRGVIVAIGPNAWKAYRTIDREGFERDGEPWCSIGDYVLFGRHAGRYVEDPVTKKEYLVMNDEDILGVFEEGDVETPKNPIRSMVIREETNNA
jgi:co-chaperonin GroES (HSP10)